MPDMVGSGILHLMNGCQVEHVPKKNQTFQIAGLNTQQKLLSDYYHLSGNSVRGY